MMSEEMTNNFEDELSKELIERKSLYNRLHVCKKLTNNAHFQPRGNGLGATYKNSIVCWFSNCREDEKPNARTKKSQLSNYLYQDAIAAILALANIAQKVAPYVFQDNQNPLAPERIGEVLGDSTSKALIKEAAAFINRFGLVHMRSDNKGPGTSIKPTQITRLSFSESYEKEFQQDMSELNKILNHNDSKRSVALYRQRLKDRGLWVENDADATLEGVFIDGLFEYAKDFSLYSAYYKERMSLLNKKTRLENEQKEIIKSKQQARIFDNQKQYKEKLAEEKYNRSRISNLHLDRGVLLQATESAYQMFSEDERRSIEVDGLITPDIWSMYQIGLLFHDVIEIISALRGDESAFERVLTKIHMEIFDIENIEAITDKANASIAKSIASERYTIWFESCGSDPDNPGSDMDTSLYSTEFDGCRLEFRRQRKGQEIEEKYGGGRVVHKLCEHNETPDDFRDIAYKYLQYFVGCLIEQGCKCNYKNSYAKASPFDINNPLITVNDINSDLVSTLWHVMNSINRGEIDFVISSCKCCGRLIDISKQAGHPRKFCDGSCRSLYKKRIESQKKSGSENDEMKLRREFQNYMESGKAINIGMESHMGKVIETDKEPKKQSFIQSLLSELGLSKE